MSVIAQADTLPETRKIKVSSPLLFALYGIIPLCFVVLLLDVFVFDQQLKATFLPVEPAQWAFWAIIFNFPHIVSSLITLVDKEYWQFYQARMGKALIVITLFVVTITYLIPLIFSGFVSSIISGLFFAFFAAYTMYHVLSQQFGIGMMMMRVTQSSLYQAWRATSTVAATSLYLCVFAKGPLSTIMILDVPVNAILQSIIGVSLLAATFFGLSLVKKSQRKLGTGYVVSNILMLYSTWLFLFLDYTIFVIMIPRFVHDITAFIIYATHDQNRNAVEAPNYIYRWMRFVPLSPLLLCPLLAIGLANGIQGSTAFVDQFFIVSGFPSVLQISTQIVLIASLFHYYIESFVWKRDSLHRHHVGFS